MDIFRSKRLMYVPTRDARYGDFLLRLMNEPGMRNSDDSLLVGFTAQNVDRLLEVLASRKLMSMYICLPSNGSDDPVPVGAVSLSKPNDGQAQHANSFLSVIIAEEHQRKGYGREAVAWALDWAFDFARLHRIEISAYSWNMGAKRLYNSIGFVDEGVKRECTWFMGGWHDRYEMAMLEHEWRSKWRAIADAGTWASKDGQNYSTEEIAKMMGSA
ncbi:acyl-CoA N-acyltransferase [Xylaria bambusicola]|uniref:acyl-CoA N-acyltransferase n=1 Tax=Xylaria bambusicola TaxID=326684 RepID=UPI002007405B|nr:acyl-CoA N-acyltransferase [Xylaria bambusicola]KAI0509037.1 acyl-CoA N-acyltransferase [Xylaria bambusicola]